MELVEINWIDAMRGKSEECRWKVYNGYERELLGMMKMERLNVLVWLLV